MKNEFEIKPIDSPHSVKISINAKGHYSGEVKCYGTSPEDAFSKTLTLATVLEDLISKKNGGN